MGEYDLFVLRLEDEELDMLADTYEKLKPVYDKISAKKYKNKAETFEIWCCHYVNAKAKKKNRILECLKDG